MGVLKGKLPNVDNISLAKKPRNEGRKLTPGTGLLRPLTLSSELSTMLGVGRGEKMSRAEVVKRTWGYLKDNNLQDPNDKHFYIPNKKMEAVFGKERFRGFSMSSVLKNHLK